MARPQGGGSRPHGVVEDVRDGDAARVVVGLDDDFHRPLSLFKPGQAPAGRAAENPAVEHQVPRRAHGGGDSSDEDGVVPQFSPDDVGNQRNGLGQLAAHRLGE